MNPDLALTLRSGLHPLLSPTPAVSMLSATINQTARSRPSCVSAVTPSSRPISSLILPFSTRSTVVPVNRIVRPEAAGGHRAESR